MAVRRSLSKQSVASSASASSAYAFAAPDAEMVADKRVQDLVQTMQLGLATRIGEMVLQSIDDDQDRLLFSLAKLEHGQALGKTMCEDDLKNNFPWLTSTYE